MLLANVGCGQTSATPDDTTVPADTAADNTEVITSNLPDKDYGGAKFTILQRFFGEGSTKNFF